MGTPAELLDVRQAASLAQRTPETIRRWVWSGRLPAQRRGRRLMVARVDVLRLTTGPVVEIGDLSQWHERALDHARESSGRSSAPGSAADLVLEDRRLRGSVGQVPGQDDDARR